MKKFVKRFLWELRLVAKSLSTVHGTFSLSHRNRWRRLLLLCCFVANFSFTVYLVYVVDVRFEKNQIYTQILTLGVDSVPFPSVIICNENQVSIKQIRNIDHILEMNGIHEVERERFFSTLPVLSQRSVTAAGPEESFEELFEILRRHYYEIDDIMLDVHQTCENLLVYCSFNREVKKCSEIFTMVKTFMGYCCAFNYGGVDISRSSIRPISNEDSVGKAGFISTSESGRFSGLRVVYNVQPEDYPQKSPARFYGAQIVISDPNDYPETTVSTRYVAAGQNIALKLTPFLYVSSRELIRLKPSERNCWFQDEVKLDFTSRYSFESCYTDCRMHYYAKRCNCIPYYYPNEKGLRSCSIADYWCLRNVITINDLKTTASSPFRCGCLPECSDNNYRIKNDISPIMEFEVPAHIASNKAVVNMSTLAVHYERPTCTLYKKLLLMSWNDLTATYGGVFSLSMGVSMITVVEIIFCVVKRCAKNFLQRRH